MAALTKQRVRSAVEAIEWMTECTLATVDDLANRSRPPKGELRRQISIAQAGVDWCINMHADPGGRVRDVIDDFERSVEKWAQRCLTP